MKKIALFLIILITIHCAHGQTTSKKVVLQGYWWDYYNNNYPDSWADYLTELTPRLKSMGIDAVWIPPVYKNHSTSSVGYSPFDHYDLGDKYQKSSTATRVGRKDQLLRMVGVMHANGIEVIQDIVLNHIDNAGGPTGEGGQDLEATYSLASSGGYKNFRYSSFVTPEGFTGAVDATDYLAKRGRWPKNYPNFHPHEGHNTISGNWEDPLFGPDICFGYLEDGTGNGYGQSTTCVDGVDGCYNPPQSSGYMRDNAREWIKWFVRQTGVDGFRWDAVKHYPHFIVQDLSYNVKYNNGWASLGEEMFNVGEYVGGKSDLDGYVNSVTGSNGGSDELLGTFDFSLRGAIYGMVSGGGFYDMSLIPGQQQDERVHYYAGSDTYVNRTVPFVNNHDTFRPQLDANGNYNGWNTGDELAAHIDPFEIRLSAAYAVIFAVDGSPQVFFEDLFNVGGNSNRWTHLPFDEAELEVREDIANIIWCHQNLDFKDGTYKVRTESNGEFSTNSNPSFGSEEDHLIIDRSGRALIGINDNGVNTQYNWVKTDFAPGTVLKDYSGFFAGERAVNGDGWFEVWTPPAQDYGTGRYGGYSVWAPVGQDGDNYAPSRSAVTTQEWEMADDLGDSHCNSLGQGGSLPANSTTERLIGKFYPDAGTTVSYVISPDDLAQTYVLDFYDLSGNLLHSVEGTGSLTGNFAITDAGWVSAKIHNKTTSESGQNVYARISYQAPQSVDIDATVPENLVAIWTGRINDDWNECGNWEAGIIPDENMDAIFFAHNNENLPTISGTLNVRNVLINEGNSLSVETGSQLNVYGNWINNSSATVSGTVAFAGNTQQSIDGNTTFETLIIDNSSGVSLNSDISIAGSGSIVLTSGNLILNEHDVTIDATVTISGASASSYFQTNDNEAAGGFLRMNVGNLPVTFPVGTADSYTPLTISNSGSTSVFQVRVFNDVYENGTSGNVLAGIDNWVHKTWEITPLSAGVDADITFQWNGADIGTDFSSSNAVVRRNIGGAGEQWNELPSGSVSGSNPYTLSVSNVTTFSKFAVSGDDTLPVELISFTGDVTSSNHADLHWSTASELNNEGFEVQKSADGVQYSPVGFVRGNGTTSETRQYSYTDKEFSESAYYRLRQIDLDGTEAYSESLFLYEDELGQKIALFPVPVTDRVTLELPPSLDNENFTLQILNLDGKLIDEFKGTARDHQEEINMKFAALSGGVYIVTFGTGDQIVRQVQIIKQ